LKNKHSDFLKKVAQKLYLKNYFVPAARAANLEVIFGE